MPEVEEVASLLTLVESSELCSEQFIERKGGDFGFASTPGAFDGKGHAHSNKLAEVLPRIDLDLQSHLER